MTWDWECVAAFVERNFGAHVDLDEEFFECPECGEPIYKCDYPHIDLGIICPVCEAMIEEEE